MSKISRSTVSPVNLPRAFRVEEVFFSTTDEKGRILAGNDVFVRISGYSYEELVGKPHSIIRHPDMPRGVFKLLWDYLHAGKSIAAYVKNMAKDGKYYWVLALVSPDSDGYLSVRFKPTSPLLATVAGVYSGMLEIEERIEASEGGTKEQGMAASQTFLMDKLRTLGFDTYDEFMRVAFLTETRERDKAMKLKQATPVKKSGRTIAKAASVLALSESCAVMVSASNALFEHMDRMRTMEDVVNSVSRFISDSALTMRFLSINASIESIRLGSSAGAISVVTDWLKSSLNGALSETNELGRIFSSVVVELRKAMFELACAKLQIEIMQNYVDSFRESNSTHQKVSRADRRKLVLELCRTMVAKMEHAFENLAELPEASAKLTGGLDLIDKQQQALRFLNVSGKVEIARLPSKTTLRAVFDEVGNLIKQTDAELLALQNAVTNLRTAVESSARPQAAVSQAVEKVSHLSKQLAGAVD